MLVSRFLLDLQAANRAAAGVSSRNSSQVDSVIFEAVVGSMGTSFVAGAEEDLEGDEVEDEQPAEDATRSSPPQVCSRHAVA